MTMSAPQSSVFTFESTVHPSHVLRSLDEQRRRDTLCDVTVVVEGQSFRAHRAVLTSCSEYFTYRITQHGAVVTLPPEVTVAGFEPLLKFAYTSKLLFSKDNVVEVRNSASILGFRDLDEACFDFLLPKLFSSRKSSAPIPRSACCKEKCKGYLSKEESGITSADAMLDEKEVKPVSDSLSQKEVAWIRNKPVSSKVGGQNSSGSSVDEGTNDHFMQCPKYRRQLACGKETCVVEKSLNNPVTVIRDNCDASCSPFSSSAYIKNETKAQFPNDASSNPAGQSREGADIPWKTEIHGKKAEAGIGIGTFHMVRDETGERQGTWCEKERDMDLEEDINFSNRSIVKAASSGLSRVLGEGSSGLILHHSPLKIFGEGPAITGSLGHEMSFDIGNAEDKKRRDSGVKEQVAIHQKEEEQMEAQCKRAGETPGWPERREGRKPGSMEEAALAANRFGDRSIEEREVAEHLAQRLLQGSDVGASQLSAQEPDAGSTDDTGRASKRGAPLEWLNFHVNLSSTSSGCPFLQDLDQGKCLWKGAELSECEGASQSGLSSLNSAEDGEDGDSETETEGDSESRVRERARQVQLPFSVDWIVDLSRYDFQQLLKEQVFTQEQLALVHDMRRRSKNRLAARRCRKRKLDCIHNLQCEINKLRAEREKLITEKSQLGQLKAQTCHSVSVLCQRVFNEANLQPEQLQVQAPLPVSYVGLDEYMASEEAPSSSNRDTVRGDSQHLL